MDDIGFSLTVIRSASMMTEMARDADGTLRDPIHVKSLSFVGENNAGGGSPVLPYC